MKKLAIIFLVSLLLLNLISCNNTPDADENEVPIITIPLTEMDLINHEPASSSDFEYKDNGDGTCSITKILHKDGIYHLPDNSPDGLTITSAGKNLFAKDSRTYALMLSDSFTEISEELCKGNTDLQIFHSSGNATIVKKSAFEGCSSLRIVSLGEKIEKIESAAFKNCGAIESIDIPNTVTYIAPDAFDGHSDKLVFHGYSGSAAEKFAHNSGITFIAWNT